MLGLIADLQVADNVPRDGEVDVRELARRCKVQPVPLQRILRALAGYRVFQITASGAVAHTPKSLLLRTDDPKNRHHQAARALAGPGLQRSFERLDVAMSGGVPHEAVWGMKRFEYLRQHPDESRAFNDYMASFPDRLGTIANAYDFSAARIIADIGGGNGAMLRHILNRVPNSRGILFDRQDVVAPLSPADLMGGRITSMSGTFFDQVPAGADIYLLIWILHDWADEDCIRILRNCRAAMGSNALLLVGEEVLDPDPVRGADMMFVDIQMMAMFGSGRVRSELEFRHLLEESGFTLRRVIPSAGTNSIIEAVPSRGA
jgi:hypothetical protein